MRVIKARELGFCMGVRRAVEMMEDASGELGPITSLGSRVHNPQVVERLRGRGVEVIATLEAVDTRPVAITAHGVGPQVLQELERAGRDRRRYDLPHRHARAAVGEEAGRRGLRRHRLRRPGPQGGARHPRLGGGQGRHDAIEAELDAPLPDWMPSRVGVLSQTTETEAHFAHFVQTLLNEAHGPHQRAARDQHALQRHDEPAGRDARAGARVDLMIVVGGRESANTRHLAEVAREQGVETYHVESADEIDAPGSRAARASASLPAHRRRTPSSTRSWRDSRRSRRFERTS